MEQAWKQSSVALGFQGVLISICSSETRGIKRLLEDPEKSICRRKSHFLISGFISVLRWHLLSLKQSSRWFHVIYNDWMDSERSARPVSLSSHQIPCSYHWFISLSLSLFCYTQRGKGGVYNTAAVPFTAFAALHSGKNEHNDLYFENLFLFLCYKQLQWCYSWGICRERTWLGCLPFTLIGQRGVSTADHVSSWLGQCV